MSYCHHMTHLTWETWLIVIGLLVATWILRTVAVRAVTRYTKRVDTPLMSTSLLSNITQITILLIGGAVVLETVGISISPLLTALGVGGLAIALGLQSTLSNIFSGITLLVSRTINPGDVIEIADDKRGVVQDIAWRTTTLKTATGSMIIVPNATLVNQVIVNYSKPTAATAVSVPLYLPLDSDPTQITRVFEVVVEQVLATCSDWLEPNTTPLVRLGSLNEQGLKVTVTARAANYPSQFRLQHEIIGIILQTCRDQHLKLVSTLPSPTPS